MAHAWIPLLHGSAAAWEVVSATHDKVVARGTVAGAKQTSDRAELIAICEALKYAVMNRGNTTLWSDNAYVAGGIARLLQNIEDVPQDAYALTRGNRCNTFFMGMEAESLFSISARTDKLTGWRWMWIAGQRIGMAERIMRQL